MRISAKPQSQWTEREWELYACQCGVIREHALKCSACGTPTWKGLWDAVVPPASTRMAYTEHGLGVESLIRIPKRTLIESCPCYLIDQDEHARIHLVGLRPGSRKSDKTILGHMLFPWVRNYNGVKALVLGNGMIYNHDFDPNMYYWYREDEETGRYFIDFFTIKEVKPGEELTFRYGDEVWFPPFKDPSGVDLIIK